MSSYYTPRITFLLFFVTIGWCIVATRLGPWDDDWKHLNEVELELGAIYTQPNSSHSLKRHREIAKSEDNTYLKKEGKVVFVIILVFGYILFRLTRRKEIS